MTATAKTAKATDVASTVTSAKAELHRLVDALPEREVHAARRFLEYLRDAGDPVLRAFMEAPEDDEPLTPEEEAAIREGQEALARGEVRPWEEIRAELLDDAGAERAPRSRRARASA
jgi:hypothetical protein